MIFEHKNYWLVQCEEVSHNYCIFDTERKMILHAIWTGDLFTQEDAEEIIDGFLELEEVIKGKINAKKPLKGEC